VSPGFAGCHSLRAFPGNRTGSPAPALGRYHDEAPLRFASSSGAYRRAFRFDFLNPIFCEPKSPKDRNFPVHNQPGGSAMSQTKGDDRFEGLLCVKCGAQMRFSCTELEPGKPGFVHRVYECTECRSTQSFVTAI
jgi:hypothetical protein